METMSTGRAALIEVDHLTIDFWNQDAWANVVNGITLSLAPGEAMGIVGESGCGKTTLAYSLLGFRRPNSRIRAGRVCFGGRDVLALSLPELRRIRGRRISLVPKNPTTALSPGLRIADQLAEIMQVHGIGRSRAERLERARELLAHVRIPDAGKAAHKYPHQLSGGQQQRVTIAMALACEPELVVLDEPTTGLDVTTQAQILDLLNRMRAEHGMAMVYVTHNLAVLASICDRVGVMYAGELVEDAPTRELFRNPRHPYTRGLIASMPRVTAPQQGRSVLLRGLLQRDQLPPGCRFAPRCDMATPRCFSDPQQLAPVVAGHAVACWRWPEVPTLSQAVAASAGSDMRTARPGKERLLSVRNIECAYEFRRAHLFAPRVARPVVRDVTFDLFAGETMALVGESGSGKSTIARAIAGLLVPSSGAIRFDERDITTAVDRRSKQLRRELQLVLQNPDASLNPRQSVLQIVGRPLELFFGLGGRRQRLRAEQLLDDVRLPPTFLRRYPDELSGGERQRVAIARALAANPKLMLCDEILSALDVSVQADILDLLRALQAEHGLSYLFISHDLAVVRSLAHHVGVLYRGEMVEFGAVEEVFAPPFHPYTHVLLSAIPEIEREEAPGPIVKSEAAPISTEGQTACPFADRCPWKAGRVCDEVKPPWQATSATHAVRCHIPLAELGERETWSRRIKGVLQDEQTAQPGATADR